MLSQPRTISVNPATRAFSGWCGALWWAVQTERDRQCGHDKTAVQAKAQLTLLLYFPHWDPVADTFWKRNCDVRDIQQCHQPITAADKSRHGSGALLRCCLYCSCKNIFWSPALLNKNSVWGPKQVIRVRTKSDRRQRKFMRSVLKNFHQKQKNEPERCKIQKSLR